MTFCICFLLCLTTDAPLTVKHIFEDNLNWAAFRLAEKDNLRDVEINEVNKMLSCKDESRDFFTYECEYCRITKTVTFWYVDREGKRHFVTMEVREFIIFNF
ncbi:MAG: transposase zinc-binding domain-containing protein [Methanophagales archaeon]|nr:transposase zinc-binding domain-containing protein [Methanophagales archaeon]